VIDRMDGGDLSRLLGGLSTPDLRRGATVLLATERLKQTLTKIDGGVLNRIVAAASDDDAVRALTAMPMGQAAATLRALDGPLRTSLMDRMKTIPRADKTAPTHSGRTSVLRLRRLFLSSLVR
jgi:Mg/Co/Ni transporter MgtE